jgi:GNAT superfamily N-acetyltransferase
VTEIELDMVHVDVNFPLNFDERFWSFDYEIKYLDLDGESEDPDPITIGHGYGFGFENPYDYDRALEIADDLSHDFFTIFSDVPRKFFDGEIVNNIVTIERMEIDQKYRGQGVGLKSMEALVSFFNGDLILICPHPIPRTCPDKEVPKVTKKLQKHWEKCGFHRMGKTQTYYCL